MRCKMKNYVIGILFLFPSIIYANGLIQNEDIKSLTDIKKKK